MPDFCFFCKVEWWNIVDEISFNNKNKIPDLLFYPDLHQKEMGSIKWLINKYWKTSNTKHNLTNVGHQPGRFHGNIPNFQFSGYCSGS